MYHRFIFVNKKACMRKQRDISKTLKYEKIRLLGNFSNNLLEYSFKNIDIVPDVKIRKR